MDLKISVIVPLDTDCLPIDDLVRSVDAQSLKYEEFEVLFANRGASTAEVKRLRRLVECRPNMAILESSSTSAVKVLDGCLQKARGEYVLFLSPNDQLHPVALEKIHGFGHAHELDIVVGRRSAGGAQPLPVGLLHDDSRFGRDPDPSLSVLSYRRLYASRLDVQVPGSSLEAALSQLRAVALESTAAVGVLTDHPCLRSRGEGGRREPQERVDLTLHRPSIHWHENALRVTVRGSVHRAAPGADGFSLSDAASALVLRRGGSGEERLIPVESEVVDAANGVVEYSCQVELKSPQGEALAPGRWSMDVHTGGPGFACAAAMPGGGRHLAVIDGELFSCAGTGRRLVLEVGGPRQSVGQIRPRSVSIDESARGTRLSASLPKVHVQGTEPVRGRINLGQLAVPAEIVVRDGRAHLEAFVSGLAGTYAISTRFGAASPAPTGLKLAVTGTGEMSVRRTAKPKRVPTPDRHSGQGPAPVPSPPAANALDTLRRRVPSRFEPAVRMLARRPMARRVYQRVSQRLQRGG